MPASLARIDHPLDTLVPASAAGYLTHLLFVLPPPRRQSLTRPATEGPAQDNIPRYPAPEGDDPDSHAPGHPLAHMQMHSGLGGAADTHASAPGQQLGGGQGATFRQLRERALEGSSTEEEEGEWQTMVS